MLAIVQGYPRLTGPLCRIYDDPSCAMSENSHGKGEKWMATRRWGDEWIYAPLVVADDSW